MTRCLIFIGILVAGAFLRAGEVAVGYRQPGMPHFPLAGRVVWSRPGETYFFLRTGGTGLVWRIERATDRTRHPAGTAVVVSNGLWRETYTTRRINNAACCACASSAEDLPPLPSPLKVTVADLYRHPLTEKGARDLFGELVTVEGTVLDVNRRATLTQILVGEGGRSFQATLHIRNEHPLPEDLKLGARIRVTGIVLYTPIDDRATHKMVDFTDVAVWPRDLGDITVVSKAPFWTPVRIWMLVIGIAVLLVIVGLLLAVVVSRLKFARREKALEKRGFEAIRRERLRLSYELHDDFQQLLASCQFRLEAGAEWLGHDDAKAREQIEKVQRWLVYTQDLLRKRLWGMNESLAAMEGKSGEEKK